MKHETDNKLGLVDLEDLIPAPHEPPSRRNRKLKNLHVYYGVQQG